MNIKNIAVVASFAVATAVSAKAPKTKAPAPSPNIAMIAYIDRSEATGAPKSEYETQAAYASRINGILGQVFTVTCLARPVNIGKAFSYDAEAGKLTAALLGSPVSGYRIFLGAENLNRQAAQFQYQRFDMIGGRSDMASRKYSATNGFGAQAVVDSTRWTEHSIVALNVPTDAMGNGAPSGVAIVPPEQAKRLADKGIWRLTVRTAMLDGQPKLYLDAGHYSAPTIEDPTEFSVTAKSVTVYIIKAELVDPQTGEVALTIEPSAPDPANTAG